jgi:type IV pilus assembly protein PilN
MRITLNLATRPFADLGPAIKRLRIGMGVLAMLSILLGFGLHAIHRKAEAARARDHSLDGQIARITQEREGYTALMRQPANAELLRQAGALNKLIDEKTFSWTLAIEDLETVLPGGVQVTTLEPARQKDGHINLKLRVIGPRNRSVDLVRNLEHSHRFLLPRIISEDAETLDRPGQRVELPSAADRVQFDLLAEYNPATPADRTASKKPVKKSAGSEDSSRPAARPTHPLPQGGVGQRRQPFTVPAQPVYPGRAAPGAIKPGPGVPPRPANSQPNSQSGGPQ